MAVWREVPGDRARFHHHQHQPGVPVPAGVAARLVGDRLRGEVGRVLGLELDPVGVRLHRIVQGVAGEERGGEASARRAEGGAREHADRGGGNQGKCESLAQRFLQRSPSGHACLLWFECLTLSASKLLER